VKIYFARHGESLANTLNIISNRDQPHGLTENGRRQAGRLANTLARYPISHLFSSPLPRAMETGQIIAVRLGLTCVAAAALKEYDCGMCEGRSDEAAWQAWQSLFEDWYDFQRYDVKIDGGESFHDIRQRFISFIDDLVEKFSGTKSEIVCISHGGVYCLMLPLVVKNIDHDLISRYGFHPATYLVTELQPDGLVCTEWDSHPTAHKAVNKPLGYD
jgi:2,3-bisphosphoglycerate-dependent phosphoglycerate mutase